MLYTIYQYKNIHLKQCKQFHIKIHKVIKDDAESDMRRYTLGLQYSIPVIGLLFESIYIYIEALYLF